MFDFITDPFNTLFTWIGYSLVFGAFIITMLTIGVLAVIPFAFKMLGVYFARTIVIETSKVVKDIGIDKLTKNVSITSNEVNKILSETRKRVSK